MQQTIVPIMQTLLKLTNEVDFDALANVMEEFVECFAAQLTPFAVELTEQLVSSNDLAFEPCGSRTRDHFYRRGLLCKERKL